LTKDEIERCLGDPSARLVMAEPTIPAPKARPKGARYTPVSKRQDRPDAIAWLLKTYPELSDAQISRLIGTTKPTINAVRDKTHRNTPNIKAQSPVYLGLCSADELEKMVAIARARAGTTRAAAPDASAEPQPAAPPEPSPEPEPEPQPEPAAEPESELAEVTPGGSPRSNAEALFAPKPTSSEDEPGDR
jgi:hypothetical protein